MEKRVVVATCEQLYQKACDGGVMEGCFNIGVYYAEGKGVKQDFSKAKSLFGKVCDSGNQDGCDQYKRLNEKGY